MLKKNYNTKKRIYIEEIFKNSPEKVYTSKDIIEFTKAFIGEATVYRTLSKLVEEGIIKRYIAAEKETILYQYNPHNNCENHFHLCCETCGILIHMDCEFLNSMEEHMMKKHNFLINNMKTLIYGECESCRKKHDIFKENNL